MVLIPLYFEAAREPMTLGGTPSPYYLQSPPPALFALRTRRKERLNLRSPLGTSPYILAATITLVPAFLITHRKNLLLKLTVAQFLKKF
jgi:hypothetical protein